jgi:hypothetical protein
MSEGQQQWQRVKNPAGRGTRGLWRRGRRTERRFRGDVQKRDRIQGKRDRRQGKMERKKEKRDMSRGTRNWRLGRGNVGQGGKETEEWPGKRGRR